MGMIVFLAAIVACPAVMLCPAPPAHADGLSSCKEDPDGIVKLFENACGSVDVSGLCGGT
jgi:hypothetical protein